MPNLAVRLKEQRKLHRKTQNDVANILNVSRANYGYYEAGKQFPPVDKLVMLADYFNVSLDYLIGSEENVPERLAWYLSELNVLHPFREGNGSTHVIQNVQHEAHIGNVGDIFYTAGAADQKRSRQDRHGGILGAADGDRAIERLAAVNFIKSQGLSSPCDGLEEKFGLAFLL